MKSACERSCQVEEKLGAKRFEEGTKDTEASSYNDRQLLKAGEGEGLGLVRRKQ